MPRVKDNQLLLSPKEEKFYATYFASGNGLQSALEAGYAESCAQEMSRRLLRKLHQFPTELWKDALARVGLTLPYAAQRLKTIADGENEKVALNALRMILTAWGIASTSGEAAGNRLQVAGQNVMVIIGESDRRKRLTEGSAA